MRIDTPIGEIVKRLQQLRLESIEVTGMTPEQAALTVSAVRNLALHVLKLQRDVERLTGYMSGGGGFRTNPPDVGT